MARVLYQLLVLFFDTSARYWLGRLFDCSYGLRIFLRSLIRVHCQWGLCLRLKAGLRVVAVAAFVNVLQLVLVVLRRLVLWLLVASSAGDLSSKCFVLLQLVGCTVN